MQHTQKYQLNLIDPSDDFLPDPLNRNMETVETQLQAREAAEAALDTKFTAAIGAGGKTARIAWGQYTGTGKTGASNPNVLSFDFRPLLLIIVPETTQTGQIMIRGCAQSLNATKVRMIIRWEERSVTWMLYTTSGYAAVDQSNAKDVTYHYVAIGEPLE